MSLEVGERVIYDNGIGERLIGKIIAIARNSINVVTTYTVTLDSGRVVQISPYNVCRYYLN